MKRFNTCFFERYARFSLMALLGDEFSALVNRDRPDLQMEDGSLGIEVTRAMEPRKEAAVDMLKEMAGVDIPERDREEIGQIIRSGYAYGLQDGRYIGHLEHEYWSLALPLRRIIASKVEKVGSGFYGNFAEYGLYIFCKDDLSYEEIIMAMEYTCDLQRHLDVKYSKIYLSLIDRLYVCDLTGTIPTDLTSYPIGPDMRRWLFMESLDKE